MYECRIASNHTLLVSVPQILSLRCPRLMHSVRRHGRGQGHAMRVGCISLASHSLSLRHYSLHTNDPWRGVYPSRTATRWKKTLLLMRSSVVLHFSSPAAPSLRGSHRSPPRRLCGGRTLKFCRVEFCRGVAVRYAYELSSPVLSCKRGARYGPRARTNRLIQ
jgi:hypothetical protein